MDQDGRLIEAAQAGDSGAFSTLVAARLDRLYGAAHLVLRDADAAEDALQEALIRAYEGIRFEATGLATPAGTPTRSTSGTRKTATATTRSRRPAASSRVPCGAPRASSSSSASRPTSRSSTRCA